LRVSASIWRPSSRSSACSCSTRRATERRASMLPRSSGSRRFSVVSQSSLFPLSGSQCARLASTSTARGVSPQNGLSA
jgi:hypothetical protein